MYSVMRPGAGIALTATVDSPTRGEIVERLALEQARQFVYRAPL